MQPDYMIKYTFDEESGNIATDEETIIIGFATQEKKGMLMHIRNDDQDNPEYITVELNKWIFDLYFCHRFSLIVCEWPNEGYPDPGASLFAICMLRALYHSNRLRQSQP